MISSKNSCKNCFRKFSKVSIRNFSKVCFKKYSPIFSFFFWEFLHGFLSRMLSGIPTRIPTKNMFTICAVDDEGKQTSQKHTMHIMFYYHDPFHIWNLNSFAVHRNCLVVKYQFSYQIHHYMRGICHLHNFFRRHKLHRTSTSKCRVFSWDSFITKSFGGILEGNVLRIFCRNP